MGRTLCVVHEWLDEGNCPFCEDNMLAPSYIERSKLPDTSRKYMDFLEVELRKNDQRIRDLEDIKGAAIYFYDMWCDGSVDDEAEAAEKLAALLPGEE